jgi:hypothetical protein
LRHGDLLIFGFSQYKQSGVAIYNKDFKLLHIFMSKYVLFSLISIDNENVLIG